MKVLRKIVGKTEIDRIRSQKIIESSGLQPINEWKEEEDNATNTEQEWTLKGYLKSQEATNLPKEDLLDTRK